MREVAKEWFLSLAGKEAQVPLNQHQLESLGGTMWHLFAANDHTWCAFKLYDHDGTGSISQPNLRKAMAGEL
ncbi:unnamed protein product, partial [Cladocopium goreaui]